MAAKYTFILFRFVLCSSGSISEELGLCRIRRHLQGLILKEFWVSLKELCLEAGRVIKATWNKLIYLELKHEKRRICILSFCQKKKKVKYGNQHLGGIPPI